MNDTKLIVDAIAELQEKIAKQEQVNQELWAENEDLEEKLERIRQIVNTAKEHRLTLDSQDIQAICEVLEQE